MLICRLRAACFLTRFASVTLRFAGVADDLDLLTLAFDLVAFASRLIEGRAVLVLIPNSYVLMHAKKKLTYLFASLFISGLLSV